MNETVHAELEGATLVDASYPSAAGGDVSAWLVVPDGSGPFPAVIWLHGSETDRDDFVDEALALASGGAISLLIDAPFAREGESRTGTLGNYFVADAEAALTQQTLDDLGRGVDLLAERPDVDAGRIGFVGHSWGAPLGAHLATTDPRVRASVLIAGRPSWTAYLRDDPGIAGIRASIGEERWEAYLASMAPFDAVEAIGSVDPEAVYLQFGTQDDVVTGPDVDAWLAAAPAGLRVDRYPAGHALDATATADRAAWLSERLGFGPVTADALADVGLPDEATRIP